MFKQIGSIFSFLTILPTSNATLDDIAKYMYLFPIVGIIIGILVGSFGFGLSFLLDPIIVSFLVVTSIVIITGIHHADGLADFADGLMVKGSKEKKLNAMKDLSTGSAGVVAIVLYLIGLVITISLIKIALNKSNPLVSEIAITKPIRYKTIATTPAEPVERSFIALSFFSLLPFTIRPSAKSAKPSA